MELVVARGAWVGGRRVRHKSVWRREKERRQRGTEWPGGRVCLLTLRISLSDKSIVSNASIVAPRFSMEGILLPGQ